MNLQAKLRKIKRKKRGVSPIIAAILLIGLAVLAGAAIYVVVLPMLSPSTSKSDVTASMSGTVDTTTTSGQAVFTVSFANKGLKDVTVTISSATVTGWTNSGTSPMSVSSGGTNVTTTGFTVAAGQTAQITITLYGSYTGSATALPSSVTIAINTHLGAPVNADQSYSLTA